MSETAELVPNEEVKDAREVMQSQKELKAHLKSLSKNELVQTVIQIAQALAVQIETNKALNQNLKYLLNQADEASQTKEQSNEESTAGEPAGLQSK